VRGVKKRMKNPLIPLITMIILTKLGAVRGVKKRMKNPLLPLITTITLTNFQQWGAVTGMN